MSPKYLLKNQSIMNFSLSYYSFKSCNGWVVFFLLCFAWVYFYLHCYEGTTFIIYFKYLLFWQLELQATKVVLHQVAITVLHTPFPDLVSASYGLFPSFYPEGIGTHLCNRIKREITRFFSSI